MRTRDLANEFDSVIALLELWVKNHNMALLREARCTLDEMHRLASLPELNSYQKEVLATMLQELSRAMEDAENWCPVDRPSV